MNPTAALNDRDDDDDDSSSEDDGGNVTLISVEGIAGPVPRKVFKESFISSWLFDIEIFWRIINSFGRAFMISSYKEVPVNKLIDRGGSRIKIVDLISLPYEFLKIHLHYSKK